jgi:hypothetical protein
MPVYPGAQCQIANALIEGGDVAGSPATRKFRVETSGWPTIRKERRPVLVGWAGSEVAKRRSI